jgi:hypothetical protein
VQQSCRILAGVAPEAPPMSMVCGAYGCPIQRRNASLCLANECDAGTTTELRLLSCYLIGNPLNGDKLLPVR